MRATKIIVVFLFIGISSSGQTIEQLEQELTIFRGDEKYRDNITEARVLHKMDPYNVIAIDFICGYYRQERKDSVSSFFDSIISKYPDNPNSYIIRAKLLYKEIDYRDSLKYFSRKIEYLQKALKIDKTNAKALYGIAETYYRDFIYPFEKSDPFELFFIKDSTSSLLSKPKRSTFHYSADSALYYLKELWKVSPEDRKIIYFPIKQLECYLKSNVDTLSDNSILKANYCFFPPWYFANLSDNWQCDLSKDLLFALNSSQQDCEWLQSQLIDLEEPCIYNSVSNQNLEIYRFTWLRSFHHPIVIRIMKTKDNISLYWKIGKGAGGYAPEGIKNEGSSILDISSWNKFVSLIEKSHLSTLPNNQYVPMTDGATWTLEYKTSNVFKAHQTNSPNEAFKKCCLYLIKLSGIYVKNDEIY